MVRTISGTPRADGFWMPGEFEPHEGCWMIWPERTDNWRRGAKPAQRQLAVVAEAISSSESVTVAASARQYLNARAMLPESVRVVEMSSNDSWMRDVGPTFVINDCGGIRGVDWRFNAWGGLKEGLYFPWDHDDHIARKVLEIEGADRYCAPFILEGGAFHVDGQGTLITTEECLLNPNRNPDLSRKDIEHFLSDYLNVTKIIWLPRGIYNDETDGHIDNLLCFVRPGEVLLNWSDDKNDYQHDISVEAYNFLSQAVDSRGKRFKIHKIHQPGPLYLQEDEILDIDNNIEGTFPRRAGDRLAASYVNFYIGERSVVFPLLDLAYDHAAEKLLQHLFPEKEIVGVETREILLGGGNIHCITQQIPSSRRV